MRILLNSVFLTVIIIAVRNQCDCEWVNLVLFFLLQDFKICYDIFDFGFKSGSDWSINWDSASG